MDFSKKYIKMCEKAEEIQQILDKNSAGNVLAFKSNTEYEILFSGYDVYWLENFGNGKEAHEWVSNYWESDNPHYWGSQAIWLPRQDQIQEMFDLSIPTLMVDFNEFVESEARLKFRTFEQLWLAFVMWKKYNKIWNDEREEWEETK